MSAPRGNREYRGSSRGRGQPPGSPRGKPTLLKRDQTSGDKGPVNMAAEGSSSGPGEGCGVSRGHGAPPLPAFGPTIYNTAFSHLYQAPPPGPINPNGPDSQRQQSEGNDDAAAAAARLAHFPPLAPPQLAYPFYSPYSVLHAPPPPSPSQQLQPQFVNATVQQVQQMPAELAMRYMSAPPGLPQPPFPPSLLGMPPHLQQRAVAAAAHQQQMFQQQQQKIEQLRAPKFYVDDLTKFSPTLKKITCYTPAKKLVALVETDDPKEIDAARAELLADMDKYDGRSNAPISNSSMPYLTKRGIEFLHVLHTQFPWAPYYCTLCDFHISDVFAVDGHLPTHMKEEKRLMERKSLARRFPPLTAAQSAAIERVLVEAAIVECRPDRELKLRAAAAAAMDSVRALCEQHLAQLEDKASEGNGVRLSLHGSLVSGLLHDHSDINLSLGCRGGTKFFVDTLLAAMEKDAQWSSVKISEAPTGQARIEAVLKEERVTIDWQNEDAARFSQLLSLYNRLHEDVVPLRQIVRKWAEKCDLTTPSKLSSQHAVPPLLLDVLLLHALQQGSRLPCVHEVRFGKDVFDEDLEDILAATPAPSMRWNLAEVFLEFLLYYTNGDVKQHVIQITKLEQMLKTDTKFKKKHFNVLDPIRERPIAQLHKAFQCYFLNCFLTTYVHFRVPRARSEPGAEPKALVDIAVFQTAQQSPLKKKVAKGGKQEGGDKKDDGEDKEKEGTPGGSEKNRPYTDKAEWKPVDEFEEEEPPKPEIFIHGKRLEDMRAEDYEIDGPHIYCRQEMRKLEDLRTCKIEKELWSKLFKEGINMIYLPPDSDGETPVGTPLATPTSTTSSSKKRHSKRKRKTVADGLHPPPSPMASRPTNKAAEKQTTVGGAGDADPASFPIDQCATAAMGLDAETEENPSTSSAPSHSLPSAGSSAAAAADASPAVKSSARKVLKLIKMDSAESSEFSCSPSPTQNLADMVGQLSLAEPQAADGAPSASTATVDASSTQDITAMVGKLSLAEPQTSDGAHAAASAFAACSTPRESDLDTTMEECSTPKKEDNLLNTTLDSCSTPKEADLLNTTQEECCTPREEDLNTTRSSSIAVVTDETPESSVVVFEEEEMPMEEETPLEESSEQQQREEEQGEGEEVVLPEESAGAGLQPTFEELYVEVQEYDRNAVVASLEKYTEDDFDYSFETAVLTAGFKCDQHCSACDSPKHLVTECPQLKVRPVREISRDHWKPHFSVELDKVICSIYDTEKISDGRRRELKEVKKRLMEAIKKKLKAKEFRLDAFGSSENGFGSSRSDFDVCFRFGENVDSASDERSSAKQLEAINDIENALKYARFTRVMSITAAKVPIVKFTTRVDSGEIEGDISYYNELALHNTQLLKRYCSWTKDEVLSKLGMFVKRWAKQCDIGDASKGSLSSYAYVILVIHFLQRLQPHPLLPVLQEMGDKKEIRVDGWDVYFCDDAPKPNWSHCTLSVGELFLQFLEYYAKFDWHGQVVQIRQSNKLTKIERGWRKLMCIEDPFDLDHNLGSGISNRMFAFIMKSFVTSREVFFTLAERAVFTKKCGVPKGEEDDPIGQSYIGRYGSALLQKCRATIGGAPRDRQCFKCGRIGHFSDACPTPRFAHNRGGGGGGRGGGRRGGAGEGNGRYNDREDKGDRGGEGAAGGDEGGRGDRGPRQERRPWEDRGGRMDRGRGVGGGGWQNRDDARFRDAKKERLAAQRESYRAPTEKK